MLSVSRFRPTLHQSQEPKVKIGSFEEPDKPAADLDELSWQRHKTENTFDHSMLLHNLLEVKFHAELARFLDPVAEQPERSAGGELALARNALQKITSMQPLPVTRTRTLKVDTASKDNEKYNNYRAKIIRVAESYLSHADSTVRNHIALVGKLNALQADGRFVSVKSMKPALGTPSTQSLNTEMAGLKLAIGQRHYTVKNNYDPEFMTGREYKAEDLDVDARFEQYFSKMATGKKIVQLKQEVKSGSKAIEETGVGSLQGLLTKRETIHQLQSAGKQQEHSVLYHILMKRPENEKNIGNMPKKEEPSIFKAAQSVRDSLRQETSGVLPQEIEGALKIAHGGKFQRINNTNELAAAIAHRPELQEFHERILDLKTIAPIAGNIAEKRFVNILAGQDRYSAAELQEMDEFHPGFKSAENPAVTSKSKALSWRKPVNKQIPTGTPMPMNSGRPQLPAGFDSYNQYKRPQQLTGEYDVASHHSLRHSSAPLPNPNIQQPGEEYSTGGNSRRETLTPLATNDLQQGMAVSGGYSFDAPTAAMPQFPGDQHQSPFQPSTQQNRNFSVPASATNYHALSQPQRKTTGTPVSPTDTMQNTNPFVNRATTTTYHPQTIGANESHRDVVDSQGAESPKPSPLSAATEYTHEPLENENPPFNLNEETTIVANTRIGSSQNS